MALGPHNRLTSWKEIASYVGRDVRTVLRWHKDRGLPVHRVPGGKGRSVFAFTDELDAWLQGGRRKEDSSPAGGSPAFGPRRWRPIWIAAAVAIALIVVAVLGATRERDRAIALVAVRAGALAAFNERGDELWAVPLPDSQAAQLVGPRGPVFVDLDGDGNRDVLAALRLHPSQPRDILYAVDADGAVRWTRRLEDRLTFRSGQYGPPWVTEDLLAYGSGSDLRIAWAIHHTMWWPSMIAAFDARGTLVDRFVHGGWVTALEASRDGGHLLAAGVSNRHDAAMLTVLDGRSPGGAPPEPEDSPFACVDCPRRLPAKYFVIPRSELSRVAGRALLRQMIEIAPDGTIVLRIPQNPHKSAAEAIYEFSSGFDLLRASLGDVYWDWHNALASAGKVDHEAERCSERAGLWIRVWDEPNGWRIQTPATATATSVPVSATLAPY
jgi:hypothetical protein